MGLYPSGGGCEAVRIGHVNSSMDFHGSGLGHCCCMFCWLLLVSGGDSNSKGPHSANAFQEDLRESYSVYTRTLNS